MSYNVGILGAGSWGITLATRIAEQGNNVTLWEFDAKRAEMLARERSLRFFTYITLPGSVAVTNNIRSAAEGKDFLIFVVPSPTVRATAEAIARESIDLSGTVVITATKGIENTTLQRMSEIISGVLPQAAERVVALSGPTHAEEVAQKIPSAATVASRDKEAASRAQSLLRTPYFRIYTHHDIAGVETGAALKNVFAIAAGICDGIGLGDNTKAALVTRGMREMVSLGMAMGGEASTFFGLTGLGDLVVTCFSRHSRNRTLGEKIGKGKSLSDSQKELYMIAEGVKTSRSAYDLKCKYNLDLPIIEQVYRVLYEDKAPLKAVEDLMLRETKPEARLELGKLTI